MFAQWDDHEVTNDWWPAMRSRREPAPMPTTAPRCSPRGPPRFPRIHADARSTQAEPGRIYRKIAYGPLLDVFMLDMRSYRGTNGEGKRDDSYGPLRIPWRGAAGLAEARAGGSRRDMEGDRRRHADRPCRL